MSQVFATCRLGATPRRALVVWLLGAVTLLGAGCGYRPVYGGASQARYGVSAARSTSASFEAIAPALSGLRSELGAAGALGKGYPQVLVEILRVDERSSGVRSTANGEPLARGSEIVVLGRARVIDTAGADPSLDTGDMSRSAAFAAGASATADAAARSRAIRDAAEELGRALGRAVLGLPEPSEG